MPRFLHGSVITIDQVRAARQSLARRSGDIPLAFTAIQSEDLQDFDFMFPRLQKDAENLLPESGDTPTNLVNLAQTMKDSTPGSPAGDSGIPAAYTYFGQFVDHDITLEAVSAPLPVLTDPKLKPLPLKEIRG